MQDQNVQTAKNDASKRLRAAAGSQSTILTSGNSAAAPTVGKALLGQ
jgi:hypothetical protein